MGTILNFIEIQVTLDNSTITHCLLEDILLEETSSNIKKKFNEKKKNKIDTNIFISILLPLSLWRIIKIECNVSIYVKSREYPKLYDFS